ncbi:MAG TPA: cupin domain-containing protein [bacterium]|nr:cupin domain-containing protein [bacterium]
MNDELNDNNDLEVTGDGDEVAVGEKIKRLREKKGMSLQEFARTSGFSSALLSQIENHMVSPPLGTLIKLSRALDVEIGSFFEDIREAPYSLVRHNERKMISRVASKMGKKYGYSYESLAFDKKDRNMEPFIVTLEPATIKDSHAYAHEGEEFIFVLEGKMEVQLGDHTDVLEPGDSIYFDSSIPHLVRCVEGGVARIVAVIYTGRSAAKGPAKGSAPSDDPDA